MQRLEVSSAVRSIYGSLGVKRSNVVRESQMFGCSLEFVCARYMSLDRVPDVHHLFFQ